MGDFNPLNAELNPICHLLALLGAHHILHISRIRVNVRTAACLSSVNDLQDVPCEQISRQTAANIKNSIILISALFIVNTGGSVCSC
jgi:hypothetical protein